MKAKTFQWSEVKALLRDPTVISFSLLWITHGIGGWGISFVLPTVIYELGMTNTAVSQLMTMVSGLLVWYGCICADTIGVAAVEPCVYCAYHSWVFHQNGEVELLDCCHRS